MTPIIQCSGRVSGREHFLVEVRTQGVVPEWLYGELAMKK